MLSNGNHQIIFPIYSHVLLPVSFHDLTYKEDATVAVGKDDDDKDSVLLIGYFIESET
jgi:hypothetical protein